MIKINIPNNNTMEREYIVNVIFNDFLNLEYQIDWCGSDYEIYINNKKIVFQDHFFNKYQKQLEYLDRGNIPNQIEYVKNDFIPEKDLPVIFGSTYIKYNSKQITCGIDIFASSFFMLSRWEEIVLLERDDKDRFTAKNSLAFKNNFLSRPVVNEYVEMLWNMLCFFDSELKRSEHKFKTCISHDVDNPFFFKKMHLRMFFKYILSTFYKNKSIIKVANKINRWYKVNKGNYKEDDFYTYDFLIEHAKRRGLDNVFYFLPSSSKDLKSSHDTSQDYMQELLKKISDSECEIGIHGHIDTYLDQNAFLNDFNKLNNDLKRAGIDKIVEGGRQHYLKWRNPYTMRIYENTNLKYDSTLCYADVSGFRCGVCYEYYFFDVLLRRKMKILERPLIIMDGTIVLSSYMGLGFSDKALNYIYELKDKCKKYKGDFRLLWHNSFLVDKQSKDFYLKILDY